MEQKIKVELLNPYIEAQCNLKLDARLISWKNESVDGRQAVSVNNDVAEQARFVFEQDQR